MVRLLSLLIALAAVAQSQNVEEIVQRALDARGGTEKIAALEAIRIEGTLDGAPIVVVAKDPGFFRMDLTMGSDHITQVFDGSHGWQETKGEHPQPPAQLASAALDSVKDQAVNAIGGPLYHAAQRGNRIESEGREKVDAKDCYKLKVTLATGSVMHQYLDATTFLETREEITRGGEKPAVIEENVGDYRRYGGVLFPCRFVSRTKGEDKSYVLAIQNIVVKPVFSDDIFAMPKAN